MKDLWFRERILKELNKGNRSEELLKRLEILNNNHSNYDILITKSGKAEPVIIDINKLERYEF